MTTKLIITKLQTPQANPSTKHPVFWNHTHRGRARYLQHTHASSHSSEAAGKGGGPSPSLSDDDESYESVSPRSFTQGNRGPAELGWSASATGAVPTACCTGGCCGGGGCSSGSTLAALACSGCRVRLVSNCCTRSLKRRRVCSSVSVRAVMASESSLVKPSMVARASFSS